MVWKKREGLFAKDCIFQNKNNTDYNKLNHLNNADIKLHAKFHALLACRDALL